MMERKKSFRWSFRKKAKSKKGDTDHENTEKSSTNYPVVLAENERLRNENTVLKGDNTRLRQIKEFNEATDRNQSNKYVFPANHLAAVEQEVGQGAAEVEADIEHRRMSDPTSIERQLERLILSLHEDSNNRENNEVICKLQKTIESLTEQIKELTSSGQQYDTSTIIKDKQTWSDIETSATVDQLNHLLVNHTQCTQKRLETMEGLLAKEMHAQCSLQQKPDTAIPDQIVKIPPNIKAMAWKLQPYMVTMEKVKDFGRHLGLEPDLMNRLAEENKHSPRDAFWSSICCWCKEHGDKVSLDLLQQSCIKAKIEVLSRGLFPEPHRLALEMTLPDLEDDLYPSSTLSYLRSKAVLDTDDVFYVTSQKTRRERVTALVSLLPLFGETAFDVFLGALEESDHQHLAEALKNNLTRCSSSVKDDTYTLKHCSRRGLAPIDASLEANTVFESGTNMDILIRTMANVLASAKHTEAMMMVASETSSIASLPGSQMSTLSRSSTGMSTLSRSSTGTMTRSRLEECVTMI